MMSPTLPPLRIRRNSTHLHAHLSPKRLTSAVRVLDPQPDSSLDSYLTIQPKQAPEGVLVSVGNDGAETAKRHDGRDV